jgi:CBS domain containing-hemolysin-like protein
MRPRREIISVPCTATLDDVLRTMVESGHSRLPVWEGTPEQMVAVVFFKDMLRLWHERRLAIRAGRNAPAFALHKIMRKPPIVPETKPLTQMLEDFRQRHAHLALVVDEFGTVTGLVTVEDVLEQIVGEIEDEFDEKPTLPHAEATSLDLDGSLSIRDFASLYGIELPVDADFETIAGYILSRLGDIPQAGEFVDFEGRRYTVTRMERNRIARVHVEMLSGTAADPTSKAKKTDAGV